MTTIAALVAASPDPTFGVDAGLTPLPGDSGVWRFALELADPSAGSSVEWFDVTEWFAGYEYTRGADAYLGRYRASVATVDLWTDDDRFAPWNPDTSPTFGTHVDLGPGLIMRAGFTRVDGGVVAEWNPRWTCKIEHWGDAAYSLGKVRQHRIVARDTLTALVDVPIPADTTENWTDRITSILTAAGWPYGSTIYGPTTIGGVGILPMPDRDPQSSAINELDATTDPAGAVWYTNRKGQLIVRPSVYDTYLAGRFGAGAAGTPYPTPDPCVFAWWACTGEAPPGDYDDLDTADVSAYALDTANVEPFGLDRSELAVINHVVVESPSGTFDDDDPASVQRHDRHTLSASWITANDFVAADLLAARANATVEARPLTTQYGLDRFMDAPSTIDVHDPVDVWHRNGPTGMEAHAQGWLRYYREQVAPRGCDTDWSITAILDVFETSARDMALLPVENLELTTITDLAATFTWTNPTQVVTPTHTQVRMNGGIWLDVGYPITGITWGGLAPYSPYTFEVRLIRAVDGIITHFSPTRSVVFMTDTPDEPVVDVDPDDDEATVTPPPPGPGCTGEWELQSSTDQVTWTTIDSGTFTGEFVYDTSALDDELYYRFRTREVCGGTPGPWEVSDPFVVGCLPVSQLGVPPFDDADLVAYWPQVCPPDAVAEAVSDDPMTFGPAFDRVGDDGAGVPVLYTFGEGVIGYGTQPVAVPGDTDLSIQCRLNVGTLPAAADVIVFAYGGLYFSITTSGGGYTVEGHALELGVGTITIGGGPTVCALNTEYTLTLCHDVDGTLALFIDGALEDASVSSIGERGSTLGGLYQIGAPADSWVTDCGVWDIVLMTDEPELPVTSGLWRWYDADDAATITAGANGVSQWADKSGNAVHLAQATTTLQPETGVDTQNGRNVISFTEGDTFLQASTGAADWKPWHETANTTFIVMKVGNTGSPNAHAFPIETNAGTQTNVGRMIVTDYRASTPASGQVIDLTSANHRATTANAFFPANTWQVYSCVYNPSDPFAANRYALRRDNGNRENADVFTGSPSSSNPNNAARVGGGFLTTLVHWIAEIVIYNRALDLDEETAVVGYLADKWGTPTPSAPQYDTDGGTFSYTGDHVAIKIPGGVTAITCDFYGAEGGQEISGPTTPRGKGGRVKCDVTVTPGEILRVYVGGQGGTGPGGYNGGGTVGSLSGGGGGATDIRRAPYALADRLAIAPGGGGAGYNNASGTTGAGGGGGTPTGVTGNNGFAGGTTGGGGGTSSAGGAAGTGPSGTATAGSLGQGGAGSTAARPGGSGGGGRYGGGGGGGGGAGTAGGGGGGGSGLSTGVNETITNATRTGDGTASVTW